jgi:divalent metal cation (Fe/Co/Zn/Cd) transporter
MATFFGGAAVGSIAGDWVFGALVGILSSFAVVATMVGVSLAWSGELTEQSVTNAFRAAVSKAAEENEQVQDALKVTEDGKFDFDDVTFDGDDDLYESDATDDVK